MSVTLKSIKIAFANCDKTFIKCWSTLERLKEGRPDSDTTTDLILFQERLATALFDLQALRNTITAEERRLIARKKKYKANWFSETMRRLSYYTKGIDQAINIGKAIGDAFAFFFYRNNLDLLENQFFHKRISNFVAGTGGTGEILFLKDKDT